MEIRMLALFVLCAVAVTAEGECVDSPSCQKIADRNGGIDLVCERSRIQKICKNMCGICRDECVDTNDRCVRRLEKNPKRFCKGNFAKRKCAASCGLCEGESTTTSTTPTTTSTTPTTTTTTPTTTSTTPTTTTTTPTTTTTTPTTTTTTPTTTPTTTTTTAIATSCAKTDSSLPRQMAILPGDIRVLCDTETDGGNWVVIQQILSGDVFFNRDWDTYRAGFGEVTTTGGDFWLGLDTIHSLCGKIEDNCELRLGMMIDGGGLYGAYDTFYIGPESDNYRLHVSGFHGHVDYLAGSYSMQFSTYDEDNDAVSKNCASKYECGWWFNDCEVESLVAIPLTSNYILEYYPIDSCEMEIRRRATA